MYCFFNTLPDEMLTEVALFLIPDHRSRCAFARVCRRFCGVAYDVFNQTPAFVYACQHQYTDIMERFLTDARVDPTAWGNAAIRWSSELGHPDVVRLLLADGRADPTAGNYA
ncbi:hypothetical protein LCGC14_3025140, partial [marine sediment metagenome]